MWRTDWSCRENGTFSVWCVSVPYSCSGAVQSQELCEAQKEVTALRHRVSEREVEREQACKEAQDLQQQLVAQQVRGSTLPDPVVHFSVVCAGSPRQREGAVCCHTGTAVKYGLH